MKIIYQTILLVAVFFCLGSCKKYLDVKPDKKQTTPATLQDCQALLNNVIQLGASYPRAIEASSDDYALTYAIWNSLQPSDREPYVWQSDANVLSVNWSAPYTSILIANQVLETLGEIEPVAAEQSQWNKLKGAALLLRAMNFYSLAQIFVKPYDATMSGQDLGIPLRLSPSLSEVSERGTAQQTYARIIQDLTEAAELLPAEQPGTPASRSPASPVKAAAFAALARVYLVIGDYVNSFNNADASLKQYNVLMDYKTLDSTSNAPIPKYGSEVLYKLSGLGNVPLFDGRVNKALYDSYQRGDLRKSVCFQKMENDTYTFKGVYDPGIFGGLATDEMYLIRAECSARAGNTAMAVTDLNTLLKTRWNNTFIPITAANADIALNLVLSERRKELLFRGLRWTDLRRLNKETRFAVTLTRTLNGQTYTLPPNDPRYTLLIPREVLERANLPQNPR